MAGRIPFAVHKRCHDLISEGWDENHIAIELDVSTAWVRQRSAEWERGVGPKQPVRRDPDVPQPKPQDGYGHRKTDTPQALVREAGQFSFPIPVHELRPEPARALEDIGYFSERYFGIVLLPWQVIAAAKIVELLETPHEEYGVINVAPGSGKSVFFGKILTTWLTARDRAMRGMVGSATNAVATKIVDQMRRDLTRAQPDLISDTDRRRGLVQAESTLAADFGRFRPDVAGSLWTRSEFEVAQLDDRMLNQTFPTWSAFGRDTTFLGWRVDFALWDDLWDVRSVRTTNARDDFFDWFENTAETRLEPGGLFLLMGQRLALNDVYDFALKKRLEVDEWEQAGDPEAFTPRYHHIVFPAIDESLLTGDPVQDRALLSEDAPAWPDGPLLSPRRLPWRRLRGIRENNPSMFSLTYQQSTEGVVDRLVDPLWVVGGQNPETGEYHPGCRDDSRRLWEVPKDLAGPLLSVAMTDPSGTNRWGHIWYLWQPQVSGESEDVRHLMALHHRKMPADQFLDWNSSTQTWTGLMEEWWQRSNELGHPIRWWIVEQNAAQRYLLQYDHVKRWMAARGVRIIGHNTHRNKHDPDLGLTATIPPVWRRGLLRIPYRDAQSEGVERNMAALDFIKMHQDYPHVSSDDLVMAGWFFEVNKDQMRPASGALRPLRRPSFARVFSRSERSNDTRQGLST